MKLSVVIPTRGDINMLNIITCLQRQTLKDFEVIFVVDAPLKTMKKLGDTGTSFVNHVLFDFLSDLSEERLSKKLHLHLHLITDITVVPFPKHNASALRNLGIKKAKGQFIQLMDDDECFEDDYLERSLVLWKEYHAKLHKDFVLTPTLMYRKTGKIQNQGFAYFSYWLSRPIPQKLYTKAWDYIQMYSGNSLLAPAYIFKSVLFDEKIDFVYEDLDFSYRIHRNECPIIVLRDLHIYHMEREKTLLEQARVANEYVAYRKAKHRMLFVKKHGKFIDKIKFYLLGFRGQPLWLIFKVLIFAPGKQKRKLILAIVRGTFASFSFLQSIIKGTKTK